MRCAGALAASQAQGSSDSSSEFAREGTAAHELAERALQYSEGDSVNPVRKAEFWIGETISVPYTEKGEKKVQSFVVDQEMADYVQVFVDQVLRQPGEVLAEQKFDLSEVYGVEEQFGTGDAVVLNYEAEHLFVDDLKFGRGVQVYAEDNEQLYSYAGGALKEYDFLADWKTITVAIDQPRLHHYDEHTLTREELEAWMADAKSKAEVAVSLIGEPMDVIEKHMTPGEKQCQWCPLKGTCGPLATWAHEQTYADFVTLDAEPEQVREPVGLNDATLAKIWARRNTISGWLTEIQAETKRRLEAGIELPGLKLVQGRKGARSWVDAEEAETALKKARLKQAEMYSMKVISPTQAEKVLKKDKPRVWKRVKALVTQKEGAPAVAPESDSRPALKVAEADQFADESDFSDLTG